MKNNWIPREFPDLFGEEKILKPKIRKKNKIKSKRKKMKSTLNNSGVLSLFNENQEVVSPQESVQEFNRQEQARFTRMSIKAKNLNLNLNSDLMFQNNKVYIQHPLLAKNKLEAREYLLNIVDGLRRENGIIIIPTGLGKTYIAVTIILGQLSKNPKKKILFLAPTKPLVNQHFLSLRSLLPKININFLTGYTPHKKRNFIWEKSQIIIATPQTISFELTKLSSGGIVGQAQDLSMLIIDEFHHQTGNYDYVALNKFYQKHNPDIQFLGMTASPDPDLKKIKSWVQELKVESRNIQARSFNSSDVLPYTYYRRIIPHYLSRELGDLQKEFKIVLAQNLTKLILEMAEKLNISIQNLVYTNEQGLVLGIKIRDFNELKNNFVKGISIPEKKIKAFQLLGLYGLIMVYNSALIAVNKGLAEFTHFLERQYNNFSTQNKRFQAVFCKNQDIQKIVQKLYFNHLWTKEIPLIINSKNWNQDCHSLAWKSALDDKKLALILDLVKKSNQQVLIFTNYRDTLRKLKYYLSKNLIAKKIDILTGTSSKLGDPGMSQKEQLLTLSRFRSQEINVLISTSVGEEGLDFPAVNTVIFYEPIADVRRYIQRLGRTARHQRGIVHILIYRDTEEEILFYMSRSREKKVQKIISYLETKTEA